MLLWSSDRVTKKDLLKQWWPDAKAGGRIARNKITGAFQYEVMTFIANHEPQLASEARADVGLLLGALQWHMKGEPDRARKVKAVFGQWLQNQKRTEELESAHRAEVDERIRLKQLQSDERNKQAQIAADERARAKEALAQERLRAQKIQADMASNQRVRMRELQLNDSRQQKRDQLEAKIKAHLEHVSHERNEFLQRMEYHEESDTKISCIGGEFYVDSLQLVEGSEFFKTLVQFKGKECVDDDDIEFDVSLPQHERDVVKTWLDYRTNQVDGVVSASRNLGKVWDLACYVQDEDFQNALLDHIRDTVHATNIGSVIHSVTDFNTTFGSKLLAKIGLFIRVGTVVPSELKTLPHAALAGLIRDNTLKKADRLRFLLGWARSQHPDQPGAYKRYLVDGIDRRDSLLDALDLDWETAQREIFKPGLLSQKECEPLSSRLRPKQHQKPSRSRPVYANDWDTRVDLCDRAPWYEPPRSTTQAPAANGRANGYWDDDDSSTGPNCRG